MTVLRISLLSTLTLLIGACGGTPACMEPQPYEASRLGNHIEVPDGLDPLTTSSQMTIPEVSPRPPRPQGSPCLEYPPTLETETDDDE